MATQLKIAEPVSDGAMTSLSDRIRPHLDAIAKLASRHEAERMVSPEAIAMMKEAGFFRALVPVARGGDARDLIDFTRAIRLVAAHCPSTAWVTGVLSVHPVAFWHYTRQVQDEFWATGPDTISSSSGSPIIKAKRVEGGIIVNGRGRWSSGCDHASWVELGLKLPNPGNRSYPEFRYTDHMAMVPRSDYTIDDTWFSTGLRGTGSKDIVLDNVFIPYYRIEALGDMMTGNTKGFRSNQGWLADAPFPIVFATFLPSVALGCADGMLREYRKRQRTRKNAYSGNYGITSVPGYMRLAEATHELHATTLFFEDFLTQLRDFADRRLRMTEERLMTLSPKLTYVANRAKQVVDRVFDAAGSSAIADFNPMQRFWRDVHTVTLHQGMDHDMNLQMLGRNLIGLGMDPTL